MAVRRERVGLDAWFAGVDAILAESSVPCDTPDLAAVATDADPLPPVVSGAPGTAEGR